MKNLFYQPINTKKVGIGVLLICFGILGLFYAPPVIRTVSLASTGLLAFTLTYGKAKTKQLFSRPVHFWKNLSKYFLLNVIFSLCASLFLQDILGWNLTGNAVNNHVSWILVLILPFMLLGEELFSLYFLTVFSSKFRLPLASLFSAVLFGLLHYSTYNNGNILHTLTHILLIQGAARIFFNQAAIKSDSAWTSWILHLLFDMSAILLSFL